MSDESILDSIKKVLGVGKEDTSFDTDIIMHINTAFSTLNELGIGPDEGFEIEDASSVWDDYLLGDPRWNSIKSYMYLRVRQLFDPPVTSYHTSALDEQIKQLEWRLSNRRETARYIPPVTNIVDGGNAAFSAE